MPAWRFREARLQCGLGVEACAELLRISDRTVRNWESGAVRIPYAAYKLMRVLKGGKFLGPEWRDFHVWRGVLHTPEGHRFEASELSWWSLLVRRARAFSDLRSERRTAGNGARATVPAGSGSAPVEATGTPAAMCGASNTAHLYQVGYSGAAAGLLSAEQLGSLKPKDRVVFHAWKAGANLKATLPNGSFYRARRALLPYGIDIKAVVRGGVA